MEAIIKEFREKFTFTDNGAVYLLNSEDPQGEALPARDIEQFIHKAFQAGEEKGSAYVGKIKREWYLMGIKDATSQLKKRLELAIKNGDIDMIHIRSEDFFSAPSESPDGKEECICWCHGNANSPRYTGKTCEHCEKEESPTNYSSISNKLVDNQEMSTKEDNMSTNMSSKPMQKEDNLCKCPHNYKGLWCPDCTTLPKEKPNISVEGAKVTNPLPLACRCHCHYGCSGDVYDCFGHEIAHCKCMQTRCIHCKK